MPRRRDVPVRQKMPDSRYGSKIVSSFITSVMRNGKKSTAESIVYDSFDIIESKTGRPPLEVFEKAMENVKPSIEVKSRRVGGSTYQVPTEIRSGRQEALAMRWLIGFSRSRSEKGMAEKFAAEFIDAANNRGASIKKKEDVHKMAEANKAFAHYRW